MQSIFSSCVLDYLSYFCYIALITNRRFPLQGSVLAGVLLFREILNGLNRLDPPVTCIYNVITMKTTLIAIGNSKGIRLPKILLEESGIVKDVEIRVVSGSLRITPIKKNDNGREMALLSEKALAKDWNRPEEDKAWASL